MDIAIIITFLCFIPFLGDGQNHRKDADPFNLMVLGYIVFFILAFALMGGGTLLKDALGA